MKNRLAAGSDFVLLVYPETDAAKLKKKRTLSGRAAQLESLFKKAGLLK